MANTNPITAQRLRELLHYDPLTGVFTWHHHRGHVTAGAIAGSLDDGGYIVIRIDRAIYKAGRLAWLYTTESWPSNNIRHIDGHRINNRFANLLDTPEGKKRIKPKYPALTANMLRQITDYDPGTGLFSWREPERNGKLQITLDRGSNGYLRLRINDRRYQAHRLAWLYMTGNWPTYDIDHIDRIKTNNFWDNLREATTKQNQENITPRAGTASGVTGVSWNKTNSYWHATINHNGKRYHLGSFKHLQDAVTARLNGERKYFTHSPVSSPPSVGHAAHVQRDGIA